MKSVAKSAGLKVRSTVKAGGFTVNHSRAGLKVRSSVKAGGFTVNHSRGGLKVRSSVKAGVHKLLANHTRTALR
jgi:hypothetical protein